MEKSVFKRKIYNEILEWKENRSDKYALLIKGARRDYSLVIAPVVADLCTTSVALSAPPNSYQNNSQS